MLYLVTRRRLSYTPIHANSPSEALERAQSILEIDWFDDDRPDEFSIECDPEPENEEEASRCEYCAGKGYVIIYGREDTAETCPMCDGTGIRHDESGV